MPLMYTFLFMFSYFVVIESRAAIVDASQICESVTSITISSGSSEYSNKVVRSLLEAKNSSP